MVETQFKTFALTPHAHDKDHFEMEVEPASTLKHYLSNQSIPPNDMSSSFQTPSQQQIKINRYIAGAQGEEAVLAHWVPNEKSPYCQLCEKTFGFFRRKHHCRCCGMLVCGTCSPDEDFVFGYQDRKVRVCKACFSIKLKRR
mmetsp:Transcript_5320/g.4036  ORF Transcript_5320/g.4036 Transcript_5320/m.4036 type:complete len:142 (+) Transcript_5320:896-1321(+)